MRSGAGWSRPRFLSCIAGCMGRSEGAAEAAGRSGDSKAVTTYRVKRGDTLFSIAQLFDTTVARLRSLNRLRGSHISVGDRLTVRARKARLRALRYGGNLRLRS